MAQFDLHYDESQARALAERLDPAQISSLTLGVATAGFQCEGGYNGAGEPLNNWCGWEGRPGIVASGGACGFWERYAEDAALLAAHGLRTFRLSLEWARVQPVRALSDSAPEFDEDAIAHYARILSTFQRAGVEPVCTLYHWTHPAHLGPDFWLNDDSPAHFAAYLRAFLPRLIDALDRAGGAPPHRYITLNEPNMYALATYIAGRFPHQQFGPRAARRCIENQLLAHLAATTVVRELHAARGIPTPSISFNNNFSALYRADALFVDLLLAPAAGIPRNSLAEHLHERERAFTRAMLESEGELAVPRLLLRWGVRAAEGVLRRGTHPKQLSRLVDAAYAQESPPVDYLAFDYYDPFPWNVVGRSTPGSDRGVGPIVDEWEWKPHPRGLSAALALYSQAAPRMPIWLAENGMAVRAVGGRAYPRIDGARRDTFIQAHLYELLRALADGIPVQGYLHWSLWDNYEWGSYQPRFGLIGLDAAAGKIARTPLDAQGVPALAAFGKISRALVTGDRDSLARSLTARSPMTDGSISND
jgi:beta-glucosidase/6-phospho-beta-glucosidase/beta-galactosidase